MAAFRDRAERAGGERTVFNFHIGQLESPPRSRTDSTAL